jgi:hypothetical protein
MIEDILYSFSPFILELEEGVPGGKIDSFSSDGENYDFVEVLPAESVTIIIG